MRFTKLKTKNFRKIQIPIQDRSIIAKHLDDLLESINNSECEQSDIFYHLQELIDTCFLSEYVCIRAIGSQLRLIAQLLYHIPYNKLSNILSTSKKLIGILKENIIKNSITDSSYTISLWFNHIIQELPMEEKNISRTQILYEFKKKGTLIKNEPKKVGELYQLFVVYSNKKLKSKNALQEIPFLLRYLQQMFKEISYDEGHLFDEPSYDNFSILFGKICFLLGESIEEDNKEKMFSTIINLYEYSENLRGDLYKNKTSRT